jgi:hypothetical protein
MRHIATAAIWSMLLASVVWPPQSACAQGGSLPPATHYTAIQESFEASWGPMPVQANRITAIDPGGLSATLGLANAQIVSPNVSETKGRLLVYVTADWPHGVDVVYGALADPEAATTALVDRWCRIAAAPGIASDGCAGDRGFVSGNTVAVQVSNAVVWVHFPGRDDIAEMRRIGELIAQELRTGTRFVTREPIATTPAPEAKVSATALRALGMASCASVAPSPMVLCWLPYMLTGMR